MYIDKLIKKEIITLLVSVSLLVIIFIGVTYAKFLSVDNGEDTVINVGDLSIDFCNDSNCDSTYSNIGQVIGTKVENGVTVPAGIYPFKDDGTYSNETPYIFKVTNTGSLDSTVKIKLKEDASFTPTGDYSNYTRLTSKYADHLKVAISKRVLYEDTGYQLGDVNMDGFVNFADFLLLKEYFMAGVSNIKPEWDISMDGDFNGSDITMLKSIILGLKKDTSTIFNINNYTSLEDGVIYDNDIIKAGEEAIYFVWLYLDEKTPNDVQETYFAGNIDVVGEFIPKVNPVSFSTDSWDTIINAVKEGNISKYNVGDTKTIDMGTYGTHTLRIVNTSTPSECSTSGFSQTACGFVIEFADIITTHSMTDTGTSVGGWPASSIRTFVNNDIYNSLPSDLKNGIKDTTVVSSHGSKDSSNFISTDKLYLLAPTEIWSDWKSNSNSSYDTAKDLTRQLDYYKNEGVTTSTYAKAIKMNNSTVSYWWLRSANSYIGDGFYIVGNVGNNSGSSASSTNGVSVAFRIG